MNLSIENNPQIKFRLHIAIASLLFLTFILVIARVADKGTPPSRSNTWGIAVCLKSAVFMAYQIVTAHAARFKRWASCKANMILNIIDTVFWFALFIITIIGTSGSRSTSSRALGAIIVMLALVLCSLAGFLSFFSIRDRHYYKQHGTLPEATANKSPC